MTAIFIVAATLPLTLLLLRVLVEDARKDGTRGVRAAEPAAHRDTEGRRCRGARGDDLSERLRREKWLALPGPVAAAQVPPGVQAEILDELSVLEDLNVYFVDGRHGQPPDRG